MRWFVYILECCNGALYTGIATDVARRLKEHNEGNGSRYVRSHLPAKVVYKEKSPSRSAALKREAEIKSFPRKTKLKLVQGLAAFVFLIGAATAFAMSPDVEMTVDKRDSASAYGVLDFFAWDHSWNKHHYTPQKIERAAKLMKEAGIGFVRIDFLWSDIEPKPGDFQFEKYDRILDILEEYDIKVLAMLHYNASWSGKEWNDAPRKDWFTSFARKVVRRYKDRIKYWEIWNEPDSAIYWRPQDGMQAYAELLKEVTPALKIEDPTCKVVLGGLSAYWPIHLRKIYNKAGKDSFDIVNIHPFTDPLRADGLALLKNNYLGVLRVMEKFGDADKPIWFTELGCPGTNDSKKSGWWIGRNPTEAEQARWVEKVYGEPLKWKGVQKVFWAFFRDTPKHFNNGVDYFGLVREDFTPKEAYLAYKKLNKAPKNP